MRTIAIAFCAFAIAACSSGGGGGSPVDVSSSGTGPSTPSLPDTPSVDGSFQSMLNGVRASNGAAPLTYDARLGRAAQAHANDMLSMGRLTHTGSDGSNAGQRIRREGYDWITWGENVARGQRNEEAVLNAWVNSPGHQANNVNPNFEDFALAKAGSGSNQYWALVFATER
ncbi:CAP domain-containing protein [Cognatiyoonia sp. IB215446]|uniref:CAP domain-containing protein n=1 Tax=Cognatiyoonia sp. IB215446 TaxID=3097355 RepID=UPI002A0AADDD|nr:CAP domain-containing protein [Cognatiyoonia sp. IB215446]MDX8349887.1 CAP domain-containing protein [Cognatiyoonia sp. IB215446]